MKSKATRRPIKGTQQLKDDLRRILDHFQSQLPSMEELLASGDVAEFMPLGEYLSIRSTVLAIREQRERRGLSVANVAERSGMDEATISGLESGLQPNPTVDALSRYAAAVGARVTWLIESKRALTNHVPMYRRTYKTDRRLLGTWRSDRRRTLKDWVWPPRTPTKKRKRLAAIFGHLVLRYTRTRVYSDYKGSNSIEKYQILGSDRNSVAILIHGQVPDDTAIYHVHFDGDNRYWIALGRQQEWFRRVNPR